MFQRAIILALLLLAPVVAGWLLATLTPPWSARTLPSPTVQSSVPSTSREASSTGSASALSTAAEEDTTEARIRGLVYAIVDSEVTEITVKSKLDGYYHVTLRYEPSSEDLAKARSYILAKSTNIYRETFTWDTLSEVKVLGLTWLTVTENPKGDSEDPLAVVIGMKRDSFPVWQPRSRDFPEVLPKIADFYRAHPALQ
jgi:hypothetical protein